VSKTAICRPIGAVNAWQTSAKCRYFGKSQAMAHAAGS
jgi:hypothetical protein